MSEPATTYVVVALETESDTPGIRLVLGPYFTHEEARRIQRITREVVRSDGGDTELVQVAAIHAA